MNKSIKKTLFITMILINIFFFNTYKVNAKAEITECYYVLPNSNIYMNGTNSIRNVYASMKNNDSTSNKFSTSEKRMYFSVKFEKQYVTDGNNWNLNSVIKGVTTLKYEDGCPKYISFTQTRGLFAGASVGEKSSKDDEKYIDYIKNYYDSKIKLRDNNTFQFDNADLPDSPKYIPLYYYKTKKGGDNKCYLDENIGKKQASYCEIQYDGINPIKKYIDITTLNYSNLSTKIRENFKSKCNIKDLNQSERNNIYNTVVGTAKGKTMAGGNDCATAAQQVGFLSAASYYYSEAITSGGSGGFKSYKKYYNRLIDYDNITYENSSVEIDSGFLSLAKIISSNDGAAILDSYVSLDELNKQANELSNVYKHICDYSSFDSTQCYNAKNACRNGDSPTSENIKTCYKQIEIAAQAQVGICDSLLAKCMEESQGITDATNALAKLNGERASLNTEITRNENILKDAKKSIKIKEDQSNPLSMLNGTVDSSANFECSDISFLRFIWLIMIIAAPILTIVFGVLDFTQAIMAGDEQKMNKLKSKFIKRLVALALFIILPIIIKTIVNISDNDSVRSIKMAKCIVNGED